MAGSRVLSCIAAAILLPAFLAAQKNVPATLTVTPAVVVAGAPELIRVRAAGATVIEGDWLSRKIEFFRHGDEWVALAGVDVEAPVGPSVLHLTVSGNDKLVDLSRPEEMHAAHYRTGTLTVAPKFVQPPPEALKEIEEESKLKAKVFASSAPEPLWQGSFRAPVPAEPTDSFGTRRMFNGKLAS